MPSHVNLSLKRPSQEYSVPDNVNARNVRQRAESPIVSIEGLPVDVRVSVLSCLTRQERLTTDFRSPNIVNTLINRDEIVEANKAFNPYKVHLFNDSTVNDSEKLNIIENSAELLNNRKGALRYAQVNSALLIVHTFSEPDLTFTTEEINVGLNHSDIGIVGAVIENASIALSNAQVQTLWDRSEPYLKAMIVKARSNQIEISENDHVRYSQAGGLLPLELEELQAAEIDIPHFGRRGGLREDAELRENPEAPQVKAAYINSERDPGFFRLSEQAEQVGKPLTPGQTGRIDSVRRRNQSVNILPARQRTAEREHFLEDMMMIMRGERPPSR